MKTHNIAQGSPEWHQHRRTHFNASDAPAMLGVSPYKTRRQLLDELATGIGQEFDAATERRFADGHRFEAMARPLAEKIIGEEISPVVGSEGRYAASFDGITMLEDIIFEHKTFRDDIALALGDNGNTGALPEHYRVQMEHQLMVSGASKCLFMATKWNGDALAQSCHGWYIADHALRNRILAGWEQFEKDLAEYKPVEITEKPKAEVTIELPALFVHAKGEITEHNMEAFGVALTNKLAEVRAIALITDQDFSNAKEAAKKFRDTAKAIALSKEQMLAQTETIGEAARKMDAWAKDLNATALQLEKDVEREDLAKKSAMVMEGKTAYADHLAALDDEIKPIRLSLAQPDFAGAIKSKRNYTSMHDAIQTMLSAAKMTADAAAKDVRAKLAWCKENAAGMSFLFPDLQQIIAKPLDDFKLVITSRIDKHKADEAAKEEAARQRIEAEAKAKAEREAAEKMAAEEARIRAEERAKAEAEAAIKAKAEADARAKQEAEAAQPSASAPNRAPSLETVLHAAAPAQIANAIAPKRPTRMQLIEAIAQYYSIPVTTADEWLRAAFSEVSA